jgi:hypothetical protein
VNSGLCGTPKKDEKGYFVKIGSWELNFWANVSASVSLKSTLSRVKKRMKVEPGTRWEWENDAEESYFFE